MAPALLRRAILPRPQPQRNDGSRQNAVSLDHANPLVRSVCQPQYAVKRTQVGDDVVSSDKLARLAGLLYLFLLPTTGPAYFYGQLAVVGDPATVLAKVQANQFLFELVVIVGAAGFVDWLVMGVVFHRLFSPVSKVAASLLLVFVAASGMIALAALARRMDVLSMIHASDVIGTGGLDGRTLMTLHSSNNLMLMSVLFWGLWLFPLGWLVISIPASRPGYWAS